MEKKDLNERQRKILYCIVREYIEQRKPISSKRVLEVTNLNWSGATVRNDMRKLEYLGYIYQPHTSAGRIPTDKGYRFYLEEMLRLQRDVEKTNAKIDMFHVFPLGDLEKILEGAARLLSHMTRGYVILEKPDPSFLKILRVVLTNIFQDYYIIGIITELGLSKIFPFRASEINIRIKERDLNRMFVGLSLKEAIEIAKKAESDKIFNLANRLLYETEENFVETGLDMLLSDDTLSIEDIKKFSLFVNKKSNLWDIMKKEGEKVIVRIGQEHEHPYLSNFASFLAFYKKESNVIGRILILTSKVTRYDFVYKSLDYMANRLTEYFTLLSRR